ncbi:hypothetical protein AB595_11990 [Massilia sp. WF1]|uniref:phasin family protein n=1 Tax=unclassified Massilia TaxID=2609279 RepID=UPI000649870D|nr:MULTISPECIES: phasin family protein [unclassified Massilia]KLU36506.1 hypothetical protein AB595_11990 [Massilia sp. WF1]
MAMKSSGKASGPDGIAEAVAASAQQIWQAGLGAYAKAQQDGGALFDSLVREGAELHRLTQQFVGDPAPGLGGKVGRLAESVGRQASGSWKTIEKIFEERVARSLRGLGVPSRDEVEALRRDIAALRAAIETDGQAVPKPPKRPATKRATRSAGAKPQDIG